MGTVTELADFIREHYFPAAGWETRALSDWITWSAFLRFLFVVYDGEKLVGLAIARPVKEIPGEFEEPNDKFDPDGEIIFVDLVISTSRKVLQAICVSVWSRFSDKPKVAFQRFGRFSPTKTYDFLHIRKTLLGK